MLYIVSKSMSRYNFSLDQNMINHYLIMVNVINGNITELTHESPIDLTSYERFVGAVFENCW